MTHARRETFALETYARRSFNYLSRMVDRDGLPYFNVFWTEPAEAAHDWPDFGDVMSRQLQGAIMARHMTGERLPIEEVWRRKVLDLIDPTDGMLYRPKTTYSDHVADMGDQTLTLYALATAYADHPDDRVADIMRRMTDTLLAMAERRDPAAAWLDSGFIIKSLTTVARLLGHEPAVKLAGILAERLFTTAWRFSPDNTFRHGGHMHMNLRALVGLADYALYTRDPVLYSRADAIFRYVLSETTRFGFLPEVIGRQGDVILCETCALMDWLGIAVTLANHGHPEYWGAIERMTRNQLVESQIRDVSWLHSDPARQDTYQFTWRDVGERMVGGYSGWSSPTHILACKEDLHWGGAELQGKPRAFQNCCGGSGTHAYFIVWKNAARVEGGTLSVNLHVDKLLPQAEIRSCQPYRGLMTIRLKEPCRVRVRIPEFVQAKDMAVASDAGEVKTVAWGNYVDLGERTAGETITVRYPLPVFDEEVTIGNPGWRQYRYRVTWKGDTVVRMVPLGNEWETGYSDYDKRDVPIYYGEEGPGRLYQREDYLADAEPAPAAICEDTGALDFWHFGR